MKKFKRVLAFLLTLVLTMSFSSSVFAADNVEKLSQKTLTVDEYVEFLEKESPEDLQKFKVLSKVDQEKFVDYLINPATYSGVLRTPDITQTYEQNVAPSVARATRWDAWGTSTVYILGIAILKYKIEVTYSVSGSTITTIHDNDAYVVKNLNPLVQTDTRSASAFISGNVVHARGKFYYKLGPIEGLSVQIGNVYGELLAYSNGSTSISYWRD